MKKYIIFAALSALLLLAAIAGLHHEIQKPVPLTSEIIIELPAGSSIRQLASLLYNKKLVISPLLVRIAARIYKHDQHLKAGEYEIEPGMSLVDILEKITAGKVVLHRMTLPEGRTTAGLLQIIKDNRLLSGEISETAGEGELLPETYTFHKGESRNKLIRQAKNAMKKALNQAWEKRAAELPLTSAQDLLVLASIIEKETAVGDERAKIASVFVNRLNHGMLLQTDPTVIYALTLGKTDLGRSLTHQDLSIDSPYNTYKNAGLPPTPICNPGLKALQAAANPADTPYFYFVADGNGGHNFARSLKEHNHNVRLWLKRIKK